MINKIKNYYNKNKEIILYYLKGFLDINLYCFIVIETFRHFAFLDISTSVILNIKTAVVFVIISNLSVLVILIYKFKKSN